MASKAKNKSQALTKMHAPAIFRKPSLEGVRGVLPGLIPSDYDPDKPLKNLRDNVFPRLMKASSKGKQSFILEGDDARQVRQASYAYGMDTHLPLAESVGKNYRRMLIRNVREIEREYDCKTSTEKMFAEVIAGAHAKIVEYSTYLNAFTKTDYFTEFTVPYYGFVSKEVDRAHRQMMSAVAMLKQIKSPPLNVNIHAKAAFVAQNQQVNAVPPKL